MPLLETPHRMSTVATSHRPDTMPGYQMDSHNSAMQSPTRYTILTFPLSVSLGVACLVVFFLEGNLLAMGNLFAASPPIRIFCHSAKATRTIPGLLSPWTQG